MKRKQLYIHETKDSKGETVWKVSTDHKLVDASPIFLTLGGNCQDWRQAYAQIQKAIGFQIIPLAEGSCVDAAPPAR